MSAKPFTGSAGLKDQRGFVLIFSLLVMVMLMGVSAVVVLRTINETNLARRRNNSMQALYEAERGIAYAYAEEAAVGFTWFTHKDRNTPVTSNENVTKGSITVEFVAPVPITATGAQLDGAGNYFANGRSFLVKAYPEEINNSYTGVVVIHSQATVNGVTRVIEYRLGQVSPYQYFFFYPTDHTFGSEVYDGRNYGGIHANGDILLTNNPGFYFLTELTSGSNVPGKGFIKRVFNTTYATYQGDQSTPLVWSDLRRMYNNSQYHVSTGNVTFKYGNLSSASTKILPYYLLDNAGTAAWNTNNYPVNGLNPAYWNITNANLVNQAITELAGNSLPVKLLSTTKNITGLAGIDDGNEEYVFRQMYSKYGTDMANGVWQQFWQKWKANYDGTYPALSERYGDWERQYLLATNDWAMNASNMIDGINREWWEDLQYGDDAKNPAQADDTVTGLATQGYILNTSNQSAAWQAWLAEQDGNGLTLNARGQDRTFIQDASQGGSFIDPGKIVSSQTSNAEIKKKAKNGGIYIGPEGPLLGDVNGDLQVDWQDEQIFWDQLDSCGPGLSADLTGDGCVDWDDADILYTNYGAVAPIVNPISDCTTDKSFYNALHPARWGLRYSPSKVLEIDIAQLKQKIENEMPNFNGVLYIDLAGYNPNDWSGSTGVMLVNGQRLPDGGLSVASSNNIYIKGDYNLDPDGDSDKNRVQDDVAVTSKYTGLEWQPAEIITQRAVYTVSSSFSEPQVMPLLSHQYYQYYDEHYNYTNADVVTDPRWGKPGASWMPSESDTSWSAKITSWLTLSGTTLDLSSKSAIEGMSYNGISWGVYDPSDPYVYFYDKGTADIADDVYILRRDLKTDLESKVRTNYNAKYTYDPAREADEYQKANPVSVKHIYNAAIVTPYSTDPYVLENWGSTQRVVNGAFIQLPDSSKLNIPSLSYCGSDYRVSNPSKVFNYETRFGRGANSSDRPRVGLVFAGDSSWRTIGLSDF